METRGLQGWAADPFGQHAERYFSGGHPTKLVRDGSTETFDDPPSDDFFPVPPAEPDRRGFARPAPASTANGSGSGAAANGYGATTNGHGAAPAAASGTLSQIPADSGTSGNYRLAAPPPPPYYSYRRDTSLPAPYGPGPASSPVPVNYGYGLPAPDGLPTPYGLPAPYGPPGPGAQPRPSRRPRRAWLFAGAAGVVAVTVIASLILIHRAAPTTASPQSDNSPAALVSQAAHQTLSERTAHMTLTGTISVKGKSTPVQATGTTNFATLATAMDLQMSSANGTLDEKSILVKGQEYFAPRLNGQNVAAATGKTWVQAPVAQSAAADIASSSPGASLSALAKPDILVKGLGTKKIGGVNCTGYSVQPGKASMISVARLEQVDIGIPAATGNQEIQQIDALKSPAITVWIDGQNLVREMSMNLQVNASGTTEKATVAVDFANFGAPVSVAAPASSDTTSYASFLASLGKSHTS